MPCASGVRSISRAACSVWPSTVIRTVYLPGAAMGPTSACAMPQCVMGRVPGPGSAAPPRCADSPAAWCAAPPARRFVVQIPGGAIQPGVRRSRSGSLRTSALCRIQHLDARPGLLGAAFSTIAQSRAPAAHHRGRPGAAPRQRDRPRSTVSHHALLQRRDVFHDVKAAAVGGDHQVVATVSAPRSKTPARRASPSCNWFQFAPSSSE